MTPWLALVSALVLSAQTPEPPAPDALNVKGPAVVFVAPVGPTGDALRQQVDRLREDLTKKSVKAVETTPTLIHFGEPDNPKKRVRVMDFRRTPAFVGTVVFVESRDPQLRQGLEADSALLARLEAFLKVKPKEKE